jgi:hypothetical protein
LHPIGIALLSQQLSTKGIIEPWLQISSRQQNWHLHTSKKSHSALPSIESITAQCASPLHIAHSMLSPFKVMHGSIVHRALHAIALQGVTAGIEPSLNTERSVSDQGAPAEVIHNGRKDHVKANGV